MSGRAKTLNVIERLLQTMQKPLSVREIIDICGDKLATKSHTPHNSVSRDLSLDIKDKGEKSRFVRTGRGLFALRAQVEK